MGFLGARNSDRAATPDLSISPKPASADLEKDATLSQRNGSVYSIIDPGTEKRLVRKLDLHLIGLVGALCTSRANFRSWLRY
jgi:hypothetical protein